MRSLWREWGIFSLFPSPPLPPLAYFHDPCYSLPCLALLTLSSCCGDDAESEKAADSLLHSVSRQLGAHHPDLLQAIAEELSVDGKDA